MTQHHDSIAAHPIIVHDEKAFGHLVENDESQTRELMCLALKKKDLVWLNQQSSRSVSLFV
jgi:hypothetical protein